MAQHLAAVLVAALRTAGRPAPAALAPALEGVVPTPAHERVAASLSGEGGRHVLLGAAAQRHAAYSELRALARALAEVTGAAFGQIADGGNSVGASMAGAVPHRTAGGRPATTSGLAAGEMLSAGLGGYLLVGGIELDDLAPSPSAEASLRGADCVVALTPYASAEQLELASVILPVSAYAETSGTWVNAEGRWQSVPGAARPPGEARPAWKVLRVLGNLLGLGGFEYSSSEEVRDELSAVVTEAAPGIVGMHAVGRLSSVDATHDVGIYRVDAVIRRSEPLQQTPAGRAYGDPR